VLARAVQGLCEDGVRWLHRGARERGEAPGAVYGRAQEPCPRCGTPLERGRVAGRATYFCPSCQGPLTAPAARRRRDLPRSPA
jgi:formamidopyrimidine-DNA glycosylase